MDEAEALAANRLNWDDRADVHARSAMYDVDGFLADRTTVSGVVRNDLQALAAHLPPSGINGRSLLHLQCHIGIDTLSWARLGAIDVHGLDLSSNSLRHAARIATADHRDITWIEGDARFAASFIDRRFEVIVTSTGTVVWLPELTNWAQSIHDLLEPGGVFLIRDNHPIVATFTTQPWMVTGDYLSGTHTSYEYSGTYTENSEGQISHTRNHEWTHDLGEIVTCLLQAGLHIEALTEQPYIDWPALPGLQPTTQGWELPANTPRIPLTFTIVARRPT